MIVYILRNGYKGSKLIFKISYVRAQRRKKSRGSYVLMGGEHFFLMGGELPLLNSIGGGEMLIAMRSPPIRGTPGEADDFQIL